MLVSGRVLKKNTQHILHCNQFVFRTNHTLPTIRLNGWKSCTKHLHQATWLCTCERCASDDKMHIHVLSNRINRWHVAARLKKFVFCNWNIRVELLITDNHQTFQVPKMEVLSLIRLFWGWIFPYISLTYCLYR